MHNLHAIYEKSYFNLQTNLILGLYLGGERFAGIEKY